MNAQDKYRCMDNATKKRRILGVHISHHVDEDPDLSHLGEYSAKPDPRYSVDRKKLGHMQRGQGGQLRYFNPSRNYDAEGMDELKKYTDQDYERMEKYHKNEWFMRGVSAWAAVQLGSEVIQTIKSGGLWGIESDGGAEHLEEVELEQLADLKHELRGCGFSETEIEAAFDAFKKGGKKA